MTRYKQARIFAGLLATVLLAAFAVTAALGSVAPIATVAGSGISGSSGDGGAATSARLNEAGGVAPIPGGGLLVADTKNHRVRRVAADGTITTVAGNGTGGLGGDGGAAIAAQLDEPASAEPISASSFLIADTRNDSIRKVADGTITTVAGTGSSDDGLDNVAATSSGLASPRDVWPVAGGGFLIADTENNKVRLVSPGGVVRTIAGTGDGDFSGDGGQAVDADLNEPNGVSADASGNVFIADTGNDRIRRIGTDGVIRTVAGSSSSGFGGDTGQATSARLDEPTDVVPVTGGGFVIADWKNERVRHVNENGVISTLAGTGTAGFNADGGPANAAQLNEPRGVALDGAGTVFVADTKNYRIRSFATQLGLPSGGGDPGGGNSGGGNPGGGNPGGGNAGGGGSTGGEPGPGSSPAPQADLADPAAPIVGKRVNVARVRGTVLVRTPTGSSFVRLDAAASIPVGSLVDTRAGSVRLTTARNTRGQVQRAIFYDGTFQIRQRRTARPVTELVLRGPGPACGSAAARFSLAAGVSSRARVSGARRGLWGRGKGRFRTRGRHGAATVRGTIWFTSDRCDGTIVKVRRGVVAVDDFARHRRVLVRAGASYLARNRGPRSRRHG